MLNKQDQNSSATPLMGDQHLKSQEVEVFGRPTKNTITTENNEKIVISKTLGTQGMSSGDLVGTLSLPHTGLLKIDLDDLTLVDYYHMKDYYQIRTVLAMINFTLMSINYWVEGGTKEINQAVKWQIDMIWNDLMRTVGKAFWAGFSPNVKIFDMHPTKKYLYVKELRDLSPFMCYVNQDAKDQSFNGIIQKGGILKTKEINGDSISDRVETINPEKIDPKYSFWYAFMMENGDFYGQKLLKGAYLPWFYSQVIHLYENRYFYRFSTPLALGKAPSGYVEDSDGRQSLAQDVMISILKEIRNNASVSLPSDKDEAGNPLWDIKYLESMMRGYDFESYLKRLDREMARAVFLPDLVFEAGRVGSYKLGELHKDTFLMLLNAIMGDIKVYVDKYIIKQFVDYNFANASDGKVEIPTFHFEKQGTVSTPIIVDLLKEMAKKGTIDISVEEIAKITGVPIQKTEFAKAQDKKYKKDGIVIPGELNNTDPKEDKKDNKEKVESKQEKKKPEQASIDKSQELLNEITSNTFYTNISTLTASQTGRISEWLERHNKEDWKDVKLGFRGKLEKIWVKMVNEDTENVFDGAQDVVEKVLNSKDKTISEIRNDLWKSLSNYYLSLSCKSNPKLGLEIAKEINNVLVS